MNIADDGTRDPATLSEHIDQNVERVIALEKRAWETIGNAQRRVEVVGRFLGRPVYLAALLIVIGIWIVLNVVTGVDARWDPPLINLIEELRRDLPMVKDRHDPHAEALQESAETAKVVAALEEGGRASPGTL